MPRLPNGVIVESNLRAGGAPSMQRNQYSADAIRVGQIIRVLPIDAEANVSRKLVEYDVEVSMGVNAIIYKNVVMAEDFGSETNFNETVLTPNASNGDFVSELRSGSQVILACVEGNADRAIIIKALQHSHIRSTGSKTPVPKLADVSSSIDDRLEELPTLQPGASKADGQRMLGEFVGVRWNINKDGELTILVQGPKDDKGKLASDVGTSVLKFNKDGEILMLDPLGQELLISAAKKEVKLSSGDGDTITIDRAAHKISVVAKGDQGQTVGKNWTVNVGGNALIEAKGNVEVKGLLISLNGQTMGDVLTTITSPVVDTIFGSPSVGVPTVKAG